MAGEEGEKPPNRQLTGGECMMGSHKYQTVVLQRGCLRWASWTAIASEGFHDSQPIFDGADGIEDVDLVWFREQIEDVWRT